MISFILNDQIIETNAGSGTALLDFIRKDQMLKGSKLVCKEGECGACSVLVGKMTKEGLRYQSITSCISPLINAHGKHIVTIEGLNMESLSPVQQTMVDLYGTQCGFCTPGFVVALSGCLITNKNCTITGIIEAIDGNICRCTGYKSIERACKKIVNKVQSDFQEISIEALVSKKYIPDYFLKIEDQLLKIKAIPNNNKSKTKLGGGTDLYVQKPEEMYELPADAVYDIPEMNTIEIDDQFCIFGASLTMGDLYRSEIFKQLIPNATHFFKLLSSTPIRNMSTIGGNLINASPIGDFTIFLLAMDCNIFLNNNGKKRKVDLRSFYKDYKKMDLNDGEILEQIQFRIPDKNTKVHFEKVSQRKYFDIATVNFASKMIVKNDMIEEAHLAVGGVAPIPLYLEKTSAFLQGKTINEELIDRTIISLDSEITPISDARGSADYKRLLARQLLIAQFLKINESVFPIEKLIGV